MRLFLIIIFCSLRILNSNAQAFIHGIHIEAPRDSIRLEMQSLLDLNATHVSLIPYCLGAKDRPSISYQLPKQWWGETPNGIIAQIKAAKAEGLKVMIKPQIWIEKSYYVGFFELHSEKEWVEWEKNYSKYILQFAYIAQQENVDLLCIGTELRKVVKKRPQFWEQLIQEVRKVYKGKLTYAANWDDYWEVGFWSSLDYLGVDAYFPLSKKKTPSVEALMGKWAKYIPNLKKIALDYQKPLLFTEYGYCSRNYVTTNTWDDDFSKTINMEGQANAFEAIYRMFYSQPWFAGGFIWEWKFNQERTFLLKDHTYTPEHKPASKVIQKYFKLYAQ